GSFDLYEATRAADDSPWVVQNLGANVNSDVRESNPVISDDGLTLFISSARAGGVGPEGTHDIWFSQRDAVGDEWGVAENLGQGINTTGTENPGQLWTLNGETLLIFSSTGLPGAVTGNSDAFYARLIPEPSSLALALGAPVFLWLARRKTVLPRILA
ncbi:MAG: hypothetical protein AAF961_12250, partial [Planctomycetota bacterium]